MPELVEKDGPNIIKNGDVSSIINPIPLADMGGDDDDEDE